LLGQNQRARGILLGFGKEAAVLGAKATRPGHTDVDGDHLPTCGQHEGFETTLAEKLRKRRPYKCLPGRVEETGLFLEAAKV
jgi:hypothetical protein